MDARTATQRGCRGGGGVAADKGTPSKGARKARPPFSRPCSPPTTTTSPRRLQACSTSPLPVQPSEQIAGSPHPSVLALDTPHSPPARTHLRRHRRQRSPHEQRRGTRQWPDGRLVALRQHLPVRRLPAGSRQVHQQLQEHAVAQLDAGGPEGGLAAEERGTEEGRAVGSTGGGAGVTSTRRKDWQIRHYHGHDPGLSPSASSGAIGAGTGPPPGAVQVKGQAASPDECEFVPWHHRSPASPQSRVQPPAPAHRLPDDWPSVWPPAAAAPAPPAAPPGRGRPPGPTAAAVGAAAAGVTVPDSACSQDLGPLGPKEEVTGCHRCAGA